MNKLLISAFAVTAVTLLSGCQHVTVRHHHPEPVEVVDTHRTVYVEHRDVRRHEHRQEHRSPPRIVVREEQRHEERRHDHRPPPHTKIIPAPPLRVIESHTTGRVVTSGQPHEKPSRLFEIVNLPKPQAAPGRRDEERGHRRPEHAHPPRQLPARMQHKEITKRRQQQQDSRQPGHASDKKEAHRPEHARPPRHVPARMQHREITKYPQQQRDNRQPGHSSVRQQHEHRVEKRESRHSGDTRSPIRETRQGATATQRTSMTAKPNSPSNKSQKEDKQWKREHRDKRDERRHGG